MARYHISQLTEWTQTLIKSTQQALLETALAIMEGLKEEGKPVSYPIDWDTEKQKRTYFATNGFGAGIPYQRTQTYQFSGSVSPKPFGAQFFKPHPAGAIGGTFDGWQSKIHQGRWKKILDVVDEEVGKLPERIQEQMQVRKGDLSARS